jgi:hypothetical protein
MTVQQATPSPRLADPVHFFNTCGLSAYTEVYLLERIQVLEAERDRLEKLVERALKRGLLETAD